MKLLKKVEWVSYGFVLPNLGELQEQKISQPVLVPHCPGDFFFLISILNLKNCSMYSLPPVIAYWNTAWLPPVKCNCIPWSTATFPFQSPTVLQLKIVFLLHLITFHIFDNTKAQNHRNVGWTKNAHFLAFIPPLFGHVL